METTTTTTNQEKTAGRPDLGAVKTRQQLAWSAGDYAVVGTTLQLVGESLCEAVDLRSSARVLDVACGNGNVALAAARRFAKVTAVDYVPALLERGRARASAERLAIDWREGDAEQLAFANGQFDVVLSSFGVMFTPDQERAATELRRVCRTGGRIGLANWTPGGFIGQLFKLLGEYVVPPAGVKSPSLWGTEARLAELFPGAGVRATKKNFVFRYRSPRHFVDVFRTYYGPVQKAFEAVGAAKEKALDADLIALLERHNRSGDETLVVPGEYLEAVISV